MKQRKVFFQAIENINYKLERLPTTYRVFVLEALDTLSIENPILVESLEFSSFQEAMQSFLNRLKP